MSFLKLSKNKMQIKMVTISSSTDAFFFMISNKCGIIFLSVTQVFSNYKFIFQKQNFFILKLESS